MRLWQVFLFSLWDIKSSPVADRLQLY